MAKKRCQIFSNQVKQNEIKRIDIYYEKKYNLITAGKSSYHLKYNLFSRPSEASLSV